MASKTNNERHSRLDASIEVGNKKSIALGLIRAMNSDNGYNYPFSTGQLEILSERVSHRQHSGVVFTHDLIDEIAQGPDPETGLYGNWEELAEVLDDIFEGVDENGQDLPVRSQPSHFDAYPFPI